MSGFLVKSSQNPSQFYVVSVDGEADKRAQNKSNPENRLQLQLGVRARGAGNHEREDYNKEIDSLAEEILDKYPLLTQVPCSIETSDRQLFPFDSALMKHLQYFKECSLVRKPYPANIRRREDRNWRRQMSAAIR